MSSLIANFLKIRSLGSGYGWGGKESLSSAAPEQGCGPDVLELL